MPSDPHHPRRAAGAALSALLRPRSVEAHALALSLAPAGPGPGVRYGDYAPGADAPSKLTAFALRFAAIDDFLTLLERGEAGALVFALELAARLDPEGSIPAARLLLPQAPGAPLGQALGRALGACASEASFRLLLDHGEVPHLREGMASSRYAGGVRAVEAALDGVALDASDLDPHLRSRSLPLLSYLLRHAPDAAFARLVPLVDAAGEVGVYAAHALATCAAGRALLSARLAAAPPGASLTYAEGLAVRLLLEADAARALDALGGSDALLTEGGRPRLRALLEGLRADAFRRPHEPSQGWLTADPRLPALLARLVRDPDRAVATLARDLQRKLPAPPKSSPAVRAPARHPQPAATPSPDARAVEVTAMRDALARLVAHLRNTGYRFAAPRSVLVPPRAKDLAALARLEKRAAVPPALALVWRTLGGVDLRGEHPSWPRPAFLGFRGNREPVWLTDALVLTPAADALAAALETSDAPPFVLPIAPDALAKAGFSAGCLELTLRPHGSDPADGGAHDATLLGHLRHSLAWAGFPGFATLPEGPAEWLAAARAAAAWSNVDDAAHGRV